MRDKTGKFKSKNAPIDESELEYEIPRGIDNKVQMILEKPPSFKVIILIFILIWGFNLFSPTLQGELNHRLTNYYCKQILQNLKNRTETENPVPNDLSNRREG